MAKILHLRISGLQYRCNLISEDCSLNRVEVHPSWRKVRLWIANSERKYDDSHIQASHDIDARSDTSMPPLYDASDSEYEEDSEFIGTGAF